jgi:hypothetical protein
MAKGQSFDLSKFTKLPDGTYIKTKTVLQPREVAKPKKISHEVLLKQIAKTGILPAIDQTIKPCLVFKWEGKDISLNQWYSSKHWTDRNKQQKDWHQFFKSFLTQPYPFFATYTITLHCNSRLDPSNCITMIKLAEDAMQELGIIKNDSAEFCKGVHIIPDINMKRKSYQITIQ